MKYNAIDWVAFVLVIVGAINWGLIGAFDFNLVAELFGADSGFTNLTYVLVGLSGLYSVYALTKNSSYVVREQH